MKNYKILFKVTLLILITTVFTSCRKDFLSKESSVKDIDKTSITSLIMISPSMGEKKLPLIKSNTGNLKFTIVENPNWLKISEKSATFVNDTAWLTCKAEKNLIFDRFGIYNDYMQIETDDGTKYAVRVMYINEGQPAFELSTQTINFEYHGYYYNNNELMISNSSMGFLNWKITECPEWLYFTDNYYNDTTVTEGSLTQGTVYLYLRIKQDYLTTSQTLSGKVVFESNDKKNPKKSLMVNATIEIYGCYD
jgi:hypothetical protein